VSNAQNRQRKKEAKLAIEMKEVEASENQEDRLYYNSQTIQAIFGIYLRVLKSARSSPLLHPTLLGVSKYAHLLNIDLIGPLLNLLESVFADEQVPLHLRLKAARAACSILSGQGEDLLVDPKHLYRHSYTLMKQVTTEPEEGTSDPWPILLELLVSLLIDRKNNLNNGRINAFLHRIIITANRIDKIKGDQAVFVLPLLLVARQMVIHHRYES